MIAEKYVELSHGKTRYLEAGSGEPIILLHGVDFAAGGDRFKFVMEPLSQRFRTIAPDFLGWGLGDRFPGEYSFAYLVDFVRELQDGLGLESSHILGHSMGGWVATLFGYESPDRVKKLVLVAAGGVAPRTLRSMTEFKPPTRDEVRDMLKRTIKVDVDIEALADIQPAGLVQPEVLQLAARTTYAVDESLGRGGVVELTTTAGGKLEARVERALGHPPRELSYEQLVAKFRDCARHALHPVAVDQALELIAGLERLDDVGRLVAAVSSGNR